MSCSTNHIDTHNNVTDDDRKEPIKSSINDLTKKLKACQFSNMRITSYDPLYGKIELSEYSWEIIKHKYFDRLKNIKQLGTVPFWNKTAIHTRYEHSIGVAHLAYKTAKFLSKHHDITLREILYVELAALCHDIGHGPYSHMFDYLLKTQPKTNIMAKHEARSMIIFECIVKELRKVKSNYFYDFSDEEIRIVQYFIDPKIYNTVIKQPVNYNGFTFGLDQIVNNIKYNVDVDKLDYLIRDVMYLEPGSQMMRSDDIPILDILSRTRIVNGEWLFDNVDKLHITDLINQRRILYARVYNRRENHAVAYAFQNAFNDCRDLFNIPEILTFPSKKAIQCFLKLNDDTILITLLNQQMNHQAKRIIECIIQDKDPLVAFPQMIKIHDKQFEQVQSKYGPHGDSASPYKLLTSMKYHMNGEIG